MTELKASAGLTIDELLVAFRTEYVIFMLGAVRHAVREEVGEEAAERVGAAAAAAAIDAFSEQLGANARQFDWDEVRELVEDQSREYARMSAAPGEDPGLGRAAFPRLAPEEEPNPDAAGCLDEQYDRMVDIVREMVDRNPIAAPEE